MNDSKDINTLISELINNSTICISYIRENDYLKRIKEELKKSIVKCDYLGRKRIKTVSDNIEDSLTLMDNHVETIEEEFNGDFENEVVNEVKKN